MGLLRPAHAPGKGCRHSILRWAVREESIIQVKTVLVIAILALARKFIILDTEVTSAPHLFGLSAAVVALGAVAACGAAPAFIGSAKRSRGLLAHAGA